MDPFVVFPTEWAAAGFEIHATPPTLPFPSGYSVVTGLRQDDERERASAGLRTIPAIYQWVYRVSGFIIFISEKRGSRGGIVFFSSPSSFQEVCHLDIYVLLQLVTLEQLTKYRVGQ